MFSVVCVLIACLLGRLAYLQTGANTAVSDATETRKTELGVSRGYIYDRNLMPLVNTRTYNVAAVLLNDRTLGLVEGVADLQTAQQTCVTFASEEPVPESLFSTNISLVKRYTPEQLCPHLIGYIDGSGRGVCGIEKSFDRILDQASGRIGVTYSTNALGQAIAGEGIRVENVRYNDPSGVVLTIDARIQRITEAALRGSGIKQGAVVVLDVATAEILALASVPAFDVTNLATSLKDEALPFLNRALSAYPVGSVFKPFVAAAALENGDALPTDYECTGQTDVDGVVFRCYRGTSHGTIGPEDAFCRSCNCYFIDLGQTLGAGTILNVCSDCGFGMQQVLTGDIIGAAGNLPDGENLPSGELANLCFGQGVLLATPLQLAAAYNTLACGGIYRAPSLMKALVDENQSEYAYYKNETEYRALSQDTCRQINACLAENMTDGTGKNGAGTLFTAAGKTATAQTGKYGYDGTEQLCTWFCGFFPYEAPAYTVVVFNERGESAAEDCAPVFREITEQIWLYANGLDTVIQ